MDNKKKINKAIKKDLRHIWHPCSQMKDYESFPPVKITRGRGVYLFDAAGNRLIDGISSWWVNTLGHCNPRLNRALINQVKKLEHVIFAGFTHDPAIDLSGSLIKIAPKGLKKIFFADNGSSAVEVALKMSFQYARQTGKRRAGFIALTGAYHGETLGALSVSGMDLYRKMYAPMLMKACFARAPSCVCCPFDKKPHTCRADCFQFLESAVEKMGSRNLAGIIIEPLVQCANGMNMYPPVYLKRLRQLCTREKIHFIADEIAVGFGRTGKMFACDHAKVSPDFMCLSKGITGGYMPFSAVLTTREIFDCFYADYQDMKAFLHSHSYTGNPLGACLAREAISIFKQQKILERIKPRIRQMRAGLREMNGLKWVANTRQTGLIGAFDIVQGNQKPFHWKRRMGWHIARAAVKRGALLRPLGDTLYFMPPLIISEKELNRLFSITRAAVLAVLEG